MAMMLGALIALMGGLFLGEYEFDEWLPIVSGALLGLIVAEIVVSVGRHRSVALGLVVASWSVAAVILAGIRDASADEPVKSGVYLSAALAGVAAFARAGEWSLRRTSKPEPESGSGRRRTRRAGVVDDTVVDQDRGRRAPVDSEMGRPVPVDPGMGSAPAARDQTQVEHGAPVRDHIEAEPRPEAQEPSPWAPVRPR